MSEHVVGPDGAGSLEDSWQRCLSPEIRLALVQKYPGMTITEIAILAIEQNPEAFAGLGVKIVNDNRPRH